MGIPTSGEVLSSRKRQDGDFLLTPVPRLHGEEANTEWHMQFLWPFKAAYLIVYLDRDYQKTIVGVPDRKYVWIMSRDPELSDVDDQQMLDHVAGLGYDVEKVQHLPRQWLVEAAA